MYCGTITLIIISNLILTGQSGSMNSVPSTPVKVTAQGIELKEDVLKYYKEVGLEPVAKEVMNAQASLKPALKKMFV